jgi:hypothetical protein
MSTAPCRKVAPRTPRPLAPQPLYSLVYLAAAIMWWFGMAEFIEPLEGGRDSEKYLWSLRPASIALVLVALTPRRTKAGRLLRYIAFLPIGLAWLSLGFMAVIFFAYLIGKFLFGQSTGGHEWLFIVAVAGLAFASVLLFRETVRSENE